MWSEKAFEQWFWQANGENYDKHFQKRITQNQIPAHYSRPTTHRPIPPSSNLTSFETLNHVDLLWAIQCGQTLLNGLWIINLCTYLAYIPDQTLLLLHTPPLFFIICTTHSLMSVVNCKLFIIGILSSFCW